MSESLAKIIPVDELKSLSMMLAKSALLPPALRGKEADIAVTVMAGRELGLAPMASLRNIHVVEGKPVLSADMMVGVALSSGLALYFKSIETTDKIATYETHRRGDPSPQRMSFTIEEARAANLLGKSNWRQYAPAMLRARAKAALARDVYPDVLAGCYIPDEADSFSGGHAPPPPSNGHGTIDVSAAPVSSDSPRSGPAPQETRRSLPPSTEDGAEAAALDIMAALAEVETMEGLRALVPRCNALPRDSRARAAVRQAYKERQQIVEQRAREGVQSDHEYAQRDAASDAEVRT